MPVLNLYFVDALASGSSHGTLQVNGTAPGVATMGTRADWTTVAVSNEYSPVLYATTQASGTFSTTSIPTAGTKPATNDCFRTDTPLNGIFASGTWTIKYAGINTVVGTSGSWFFRFRIWAATSVDGQTGAREITSGAISTGTFNFTSTTQQNHTATFSPGTALIFANEYLFIKHAWAKNSGAVTAGGTEAAIVQDGTNCLVITPNFIPAFERLSTDLPNPRLAPPPLPDVPFFAPPLTAAVSVAEFQRWTNDTAAPTLQAPLNTEPFFASPIAAPATSEFQTWSVEPKFTPFAPKPPADTYLPTASLGWAPVPFQAWTNDLRPALAVRHVDGPDPLPRLAGSPFFDNFIAWSNDIAIRLVQRQPESPQDMPPLDRTAIFGAFESWTNDLPAPRLAALRFDVPYTGNTIGWAPTPFQMWTNDVTPRWAPKPVETPQHLPQLDQTSFFSEWQAWTNDLPAPRLTPPRPEVPYTGNTLGWAPVKFLAWATDVRVSLTPLRVAEQPFFNAPLGSPPGPVEFQQWTNDLPAPRLRGQNEQPPFVGTSLGWAPTEFLTWTNDVRHEAPPRPSPQSDLYPGRLLGVASAGLLPWATEPSRPGWSPTIRRGDVEFFGTPLSFGASHFIAWSNDPPMPRLQTARLDAGTFLGSTLAPPPPLATFQTWTVDLPWKQAPGRLAVSVDVYGVFKAPIVPPASVVVTVVRPGTGIAIVAAYPGALRIIGPSTGIPVVQPSRLFSAVQSPSAVAVVASASQIKANSVQPAIRVIENLKGN